MPFYRAVAVQWKKKEKNGTRRFPGNTGRDMSKIWTVTPHLFAFGRESSDSTLFHGQSLPGCVDSSKQLNNWSHNAPSHRQRQLRHYKLTLTCGWIRSEATWELSCNSLKWFDILVFRWLEAIDRLSVETSIRLSSNPQGGEACTECRSMASDSRRFNC